MADDTRVGKLARLLAVMVPLLIGCRLLTLWARATFDVEGLETILLCVGPFLGWAGVQVVLEWNWRVARRERQRASAERTALIFEEWVARDNARHGW